MKCQTLAMPLSPETIARGMVKAAPERKSYVPEEVEYLHQMVRAGGDRAKWAELELQHQAGVA